MKATINITELKELPKNLEPGAYLYDDTIYIIDKQGKNICFEKFDRLKEALNLCVLNPHPSDPTEFLNFPRIDGKELQDSERQKKEYLTISELKENEFYKCRLSGNTVMVMSLYIDSYIRTATIYYYDKTNQTYEQATAYDYMLYELQNHK